MQMSPELQTPRLDKGVLAETAAVLVPKQQVLFAGAPPQVVGYVALHNPTKCRVRARYLYLQCEARGLFDPLLCPPEPGPIELQQAVGCANAPTQDDPPINKPTGATEGSVSWASDHETQSATQGALPLRVISVRVKLGACEARELRLAVPVSLSAPPGEYPATLFDPQGASCPATIQVHERRVTRVHPSVVPCSAAPGAKLSWEVHIKNVGNVVSELSQGAVVHLSSGDENWHRHFHRAVARVGGQGHEQVLNQFVESLGESEHGPIKGKLTRGAGQLAPGEARLVTLELTVPKKLPPRRYFNAVTRLGDGLFTAALYITSGDADHSSEPHEPEPIP